MELWELRQKQSLPLDAKVVLSEERIREFHDAMGGDMYVAFSGGKDSWVLLNIVRKIYPKTPAVFSNTGLEYPEILDFVKTVPNVVWLRPDIIFPKVIEKWGYPVASKKISRIIWDMRTLPEIKPNQKTYYDKYLTNRWKCLLDAPFMVSNKCCYYLKHKPFAKYEKETGLHPIIGTMASEGGRREEKYLEFGCNILSGKHPQSKPLSIWLETDIWKYIGKHDLSYSKIYDMGETRTGCMFCMYGVHLEGTPNRFQRMAKSHPKQYKYCIEKLGIGKVLDYINVDYKPIKTLEEFDEM
jgi:3'-phosphoadenosine 5'-phosphosulfate sulfotransferase (PAPS reductase)/FAD synthetase